MGNIPSPAPRGPPPPLRQPPPPPGHHQRKGVSQTTNGEELNSEMAGENSVYEKCRTRPYYSRRCKRMMPTNIESLPDEMVFKILLYLPAQDIYNVARLVCRKWYHMIHSHNFIYAHLHHSTGGLLIQNRRVAKQRSPIFVAMNRGRIEITKFSYKFRDIVWTSCNGLLLEGDSKTPASHCIANPATKQHFALPPLPLNVIRRTYSGLGYVSSTMEYKVVHTYDCNDGEANIRCAILTVGVDEIWRHVETEHLSISARKLLCRIPLITEGFAHWACNTHIVTLDLQTETIRQLPSFQGNGEKSKYYFSGGRYISSLTACSKYLWDVWELKPDDGEWTKLDRIDLEARKRKIEKLARRRHRDCSLEPIGWIKYKEVLVFRVLYLSKICIAYNVCTKEICWFWLDSIDDVYGYVVHTNSLVWLGGC